MTQYTPSKIGMYGPNDRALQSSLAYEHEELTAKVANVFMYLGSRVNATPAITDVEDPILLENVDRAYASTSIPINIWVEPLPENVVDLSALGIINPLGNEQRFRVHINSFESDGLGRYLIAGDVLQIPFFTQDGYPTYFEVQDVDRKAAFENFYVTINTVRADDNAELTEILNKRLMIELGTIMAAAEVITSAQVPVAGTTELQTAVSALRVTNVGSGYTSAPSVSIIGGGGSGATATAYTDTGVGVVTITNGGAGYTSKPVVGFTGGGGTGATGVATVSAGAVTNVVMTSGGTGYTSAPIMTITGGGGTGATATAALSGVISVLDLTKTGAGYTTVPSVVFSGGAGSGAAAVAVISGAAIVTDPSANSEYAPTVTDANQASFLDDPESLNF